MKTMTMILTISLVCLALDYSYSQDVIFKTDGSEIRSRVMEISSDNIRYKSWDQQDGPIRNISISDVFMIIYDDGTVENFKKASTIVVEEKRDEASNIIESDNNNSSQVINNEVMPIIKTDKRDVFDFGIRAGCYFPEDKAMVDIYGIAFNPGFDFRYWGKKAIGIGSSIDLITKKGKPYEIGDIDYSSSKITIIPVRTSLLITYAQNDHFRSYSGIGIGFDFAFESGEFSYDGSDDELSGSAVAFEIHSFSGFCINKIYFELKYNYAPLSSAGAADNLGGLIISVGIKF